MDMMTALTEFAYSKDHSAESRRWYKSRLGAFVQWCDQQGVTNLEDITAPLVRRYVDYRRTTPTAKGRPLDSHTLHGHVRAIRTLLYWAAKEDLIDEKVARRIGLPKKETKLLPILSNEQIAKLIAACDQSETPEQAARDKTILAVLLDTGIRAAELCGLTLDQAVFSTDEAYLRVFGKGKKRREVGLGRKSRQLLHRYIHRHRKAPADQRYVFLGKTGKPMRPEGLDRMLYRLRDRAGLRGAKIAAHVWRHSYAVRYLEAGGDVYRLKTLLGHQSVQTTEGYVKHFSAKTARQGASVFDQMRGA
jgi:site-specific recombinase XerD